MKYYNYFIILAIISLIPLIFSIMFPYTAARRLYLNTQLNSEHTGMGQPKLFVISLEEGNQYTIDVDVSSNWGMDIIIKISNTPHILAGQMVDNNSYEGDCMNFLASTTGDYYILIVAKSGSGFFSIRVDSGLTYPATGSLSDFVGSRYLLVLILPSTIIFLVGMCILLIIRKKKKVPVIKKDIYTQSYYDDTERYPQEKKVETDTLTGKEEKNFCSYCGTKLQRFAKFCPNCGKLVN